VDQALNVEGSFKSGDDSGTGSRRPELIDLILGRQSVSPKRLIPPGPTDAEIRTMIAAAVTVPDHCGLRPWRFLRIAEAARQSLADLFVEAKRRRVPDADADVFERERDKALRAPVLIAVCARIDPDNPKVPPGEQFASVGAAIQNVLLAAHALGYGGIMLSGEKTRDPLIRDGFGLGDDEALVGFISLGSAAAAAPRKPRPDPDDHLQIWNGPEAN
jgi:nitroreductase